MDIKRERQTEEFNRERERETERESATKRDSYSNSALDKLQASKMIELN